MNVRAMTKEEFYSFEWIPHTVFTRTIETVIADDRLYVKDYDDLDWFQAVGIVVDDQPMAVISYKGYPNGATCLFLPRAIEDEAAITALIQKGLEAFDIDPTEMTWQRKDGMPDQRVGMS